MLRSAAVSCTLLAVMIGASRPAAGGAITIGGPPATIGGISVPFAGGLRYQQIYNSDEFTTGPVAITGITFFDTVGTGGIIDDTTYTLLLSTSSTTVNNLSTTDFSANHGSPNSPHTFFTGELASSNGIELNALFKIVLTGTELTFSGSAFNYDPALGDLLLEIVKTSDPSENTPISFDSSNGGSIGTFSLLRSSEADGSNAVAENNFGLVTRFETQAAVVIPEPSTATLAALAALLLCGYWRCKAHGLRPVGSRLTT